MPRINLLPWREELRQKRKKDFLMALLGAVLFGGLLVYGAKLFVGAQIENQMERNDLLRDEIAQLEERIEEIMSLERQKERLIARMRIIEELQQARPLSVHLVDEIVNTLPDGTYLTRVEQTDNRVEFTGMAESSARITAMLRNIDSSPWFKQEPEYGGHERVRVGNRDLFEFSITAEQVPINADEDEEDQP